MKKTVAFLLLLAMGLSVATFTLGEAEPAPATGSMNVAVEGEASHFTLESYPDVYLTVNDVEKIIKGGDKRNKPIFLNFWPPEGTVPTTFGPARAAFTSEEEGLSYYYYVINRARFNTYLNGIKDEFIIADGKDGIAAMYVGNEDHRAYALVSLPGTEFTDMARVNVAIADLTGQRSREELVDLIEDEVNRLLIDMRFVEFDKYWADDTYATVQLTAEEDPVQATVDTAGLVVTGMDSASSLRYIMRMEDGKVRAVAIKLSPYSYAYMDHGEKRPTSDYTLADGTKGKTITFGSTSYAGFPVLEEASYGGGPLYLTFEIEVSSADDFLPLLEEAYGRLTLAAQ